MFEVLLLAALLLLAPSLGSADTQPGAAERRTRQRQQQTAGGRLLPLKRDMIRTRTVCMILTQQLARYRGRNDSTTCHLLGTQQAIGNRWITTQITLSDRSAIALCMP